MLCVKDTKPSSGPSGCFTMTFSGHMRTDMAKMFWNWPSQATSGHHRWVNLESQAEPGAATSTTEGGLDSRALVPRTANLAPFPPSVDKTNFGSQHLTQGLKLFLFCRYNQGEIIPAEADREADKGLLGPGQVAHQG